jgi:mono/diheme cytochrome c family protein
LLAIALPAAGCGGAETAEPLPDTVQGTIQQDTLPPGDTEAGGTVFEEQNCGSCHTYGPAGSQAEVGPNLDESLQGQDTEYIRTAIVAPDAEIAEGFQPGIMPKTYGEDLDDQQIADLVAFLQQ